MIVETSQPRNLRIVGRLGPWTRDDVIVSQGRGFLFTESSQFCNAAQSGLVDVSFFFLVDSEA